jgi:hypothetical protein
MREGLADATTTITVDWLRIMTLGANDAIGRPHFNGEDARTLLLDTPTMAGTSRSFSARTKLLQRVTTTRCGRRARWAARTRRH